MFQNREQKVCHIIVAYSCASSRPVPNGILMYSYWVLTFLEKHSDGSSFSYKFKQCLEIGTKIYRKNVEAEISGSICNVLKQWKGDILRSSLVKVL